MGSAKRTIKKNALRFFVVSTTIIVFKDHA